MAPNLALSPLTRQSEIYQRQGVGLSKTTLSSWVQAVTDAPLLGAIAEAVGASLVLFFVPLLGLGLVTGVLRFWADPELEDQREALATTALAATAGLALAGGAVMLVGAEWIAAGLLGETYQYWNSDGNYYVGDSGWHSDTVWPAPIHFYKMHYYLWMKPT